MDQVFLLIFLATLRLCDLKPLLTQPDDTSNTTTPVTKKWPTTVPTTVPAYVKLNPNPRKAVKPTINSSNLQSLLHLRKPTTLPISTTEEPTSLFISTTEEPRTLPKSTTEDPESLLRKYQVFPAACGIQQHKQNPTKTRRKRVVGGQSAQEGQFPWQVALLFKGQHYCGGSIIHRNWIVTGSHCFNPYTSYNPEDWIVKIGEHRLRDKESFEQSARITNITTHKLYKSMWFEGITDTPPTYDIALLKLKKPLVFDRHIQPICILRPDTHFDWGQKCTVSGWGHLKWNGSQPNLLNYAEVPIVSYKECNKEKSYNGTIHGTALCAGYQQGKVDSCEYDSGGPLSCKKCGRYYLTGVVSWGHECARPHKYGVYARMEALTPWVVSIIGEVEGVMHSKKVRVG